MKTHELKTWPEFFSAVMRGRKKFEVRKNDRNFQEGDQLLLREYDPETKQYLGSQLVVDVGYILPLKYLGEKSDFVVMGIEIA